jgi:hypothetical protein
LAHVPSPQGRRGAAAREPSQTFLEGDDLSSRSERNGYRTALVLFAVAVIIAMLVAFVTTLETVDKGWLTRHSAETEAGRLTFCCSARTFPGLIYSIAEGMDRW